MNSYPEKLEHWKKRAAWLRKGFEGPKAAITLLDDVLAFLNGDTRETTMVHWCLLDTGSGKPCCDSDAQSWTKLPSMLTSLLSNAYPVPLLYRMKHYASASSFVRVGCCLHSILPRALLRVGQTRSSEGAMSETEMVDIQEGEAAQSDVGGRKLTDQDLQTLIATFWMVMKTIQRRTAQDCRWPKPRSPSDDFISMLSSLTW